MPELAPLPRRRLAAMALGGLACSVLAALAARYPWSNDDATHYLKALGAWDDPWRLLDFWGRPVFNVVHALPARLGFLACRLTSAIASLAVGLVAVALARRLRLPRPELALALAYLQPVFFQLSFGALTETLGALLLGLGLVAWADRRWVRAGLLLGLVPLARPEGVPLAALAGLGMLLHAASDLRHAPRTRAAVAWAARLGLLGAGVLVWNLLGWIHSGDPLWLWHQNVYARGGPGLYGFGRWFDYLRRLPEIVGPLMAPVLLLGLVARRADDVPAASRRLHRELVVLWLAFGVLQSVLWTFGLFRSGGYSRFFVTLTPVTAVLTLAGGAALIARVGRHGRRVGIGLAIASLALLPRWIDFCRTRPDYAAFERLDQAYREYVGQHGMPPRVYCNYEYFHFLHGLASEDPRYPRMTAESLATAPAGSLVLWVHPYQRRVTGIEPTLFYPGAAIERLQRAHPGEQVLHRLHRARTPWRELADHSQLSHPADPWPFFAKLLRRGVGVEPPR